MIRSIPARCPFCDADWSDARATCQQCGAAIALSNANPLARCPGCGIAFSVQHFACAACGGHWSEDAALDGGAPVTPAPAWRPAFWPADLVLRDGSERVPPATAPRWGFWRRLRWLVLGERRG